MNPWVSLTRPHTLPAGASPVIVGLALASLETSLNIIVAVLTLLCALLLQISSNIINDYYDGIKGSDNNERLGPQRVTSSGILSKKKVKIAFILTLLASFILGLYLMFIGEIPAVIIGVSSIFFAWAYTGGPYPLSYYALGEVFALIFFGPVALWGTYYLQTLNLKQSSFHIILWGIAIGLIASAIMGINNLRDIKQDNTSKKMTLATIMGEESTRYIINIYILVSLIMICYFTTPLLSIVYILFYKNWKGILKDAKGNELNNNLALTGKYLFIISLSSTLYMIIK
jgi:1,4-dihydroxy-2-naphthoate octaprenyltransferase